MSNFCVIGSGISGATIANLLSKKYSVDLFDKARGPGGRASFKRLDHFTIYPNLALMNNINFIKI